MSSLTNTMEHVIDSYTLNTVCRYVAPLWMYSVARCVARTVCMENMRRHRLDSISSNSNFVKRFIFNTFVGNFALLGAVQNGLFSVSRVFKLIGKSNGSRNTNLYAFDDIPALHAAIEVVLNEIRAIDELKIIFTGIFHIITTTLVRPFFTSIRRLFAQQPSMLTVFDYMRAMHRFHARILNGSRLCSSCFLLTQFLLEWPVRRIRWEMPSSCGFIVISYQVRTEQKCLLFFTCACEL